MKRAYSPKEIQSMNIPSFPFTDEWEATFGTPDRTGTWIVWGDSGNGKSSFVMQLAKYLCQFDKVIYDSLEESTGLSKQYQSLPYGRSERKVPNSRPGTNE